MTKALPTHGIKSATPRFIDKGGVLKSLVGGKDQRLDRPGSKWGVSFKTRPMKIEDARIWAARLIAGQREKVSIAFPQPGFMPEQNGDYVVSVPVAANATQLMIQHPTNAIDVGKFFREGQFISFLKGGNRYVHQIMDDAAIALAGAVSYATINIQPPLRLALVGSDPVEVLMPNIEGYVSADDFGWDIDDAKIHGFTFDIEEAQ